VEQAAGIILLYFLAYLFRHAVFHCIHQELGGPFNADHRKEPQRDDQFVSLCVADVAAGYCAANSLRDFVTAAATAAVLFRLYDLAGKNDGIHCFHNSDGKIGGHGTAAAILGRTEAGAVIVTLEHTYISFAAEQDYFLFYNGNAFDFLYISRGNTRFTSDTDIDLDCQLIESSVKGNTINIDVRPNDPGTFATNGNASIHKLLAVPSQEYTYILETVLVAAGIENFPCVDAYGFPDVVQVADRAGHDSISHLINLP